MTLQRRLYDLRRALFFAAARLLKRPLHNPIFIIGSARSGTTLLNDVLAQHPDIAVWSEANAVWDVTDWEYATSRRQTPPQWFDNASFEARWARDNMHRATDIRAIFGLYQTLRRKPYFLNKAPENVYRLRFIAQSFPAARLIHIVRDGRAVAYSRARRAVRNIEENPEMFAPWGIIPQWEPVLLGVARDWQSAVDAVERDATALRLREDGRMLDLRYEDLCADLRGELDRLGDFLSLDLTGITAEVDNRNHKWREALDPNLIPAYRAAMKRGLKRWGYT